MNRKQKTYETHNLNSKTQLGDFNAIYTESLRELLLKPIFLRTYPTPSLTRVTGNVHFAESYNGIDIFAQFPIAILFVTCFVVYDLAGLTFNLYLYVNLLVNKIRFTLYPTHSGVGRGNLVLRLVFLLNSVGIVC